MSDEDNLRKIAKRLEAEKRGRALGIVGPSAAACGEWLGWIFETPGVAKAMVPACAPKLKPEDDPPTTTYSRLPPKEDEQSPDQGEPEPAEWHRTWVTVQSPTDDDPGAIEEAQYAVAGDEVLIADFDGRTMGARRLGPNDDPLVIAKRLLRERRPKRAKLVFPNVGVA